MNGYTKLFGSIIASTIWREDNDTRIVWITMLAMANKNGIVEASVPGLADLSRVSVDKARIAITKLESPDEDSRTKEHDGRRISPIDGGWILLNHAKYRAKMSNDERREYFRIKKQEQRGLSTMSTMSTDVLGLSKNVTQAEEADAEAYPSNKTTKSYKHRKKFSKSQAELTALFDSLLGDQWENDRVKWLGRIFNESGKCGRVVAELGSAIKESRISTTPAQYAEQIWKEFE